MGGMTRLSLRLHPIAASRRTAGDPTGLPGRADPAGMTTAPVVRIVRVGAFVQSDDGWTEQPKVANGGSELLQQLFGEAGRHARAAVGTNALPLGASVEIELLFEIR